MRDASKLERVLQERKYSVLLREPNISMDLCAHDEGTATPASSAMMIKVVAPPERVYSVWVPSADVDLEGRARFFQPVHCPQ